MVDDAGRVQVVGAALVRDGQVLAARRTRPEAAAGRWELPGGKVEPGESPEDALVRELVEELGCTVEVLGWLEGAAPIGATHELTVAHVRLLDGDPEPREDGHDAVRWLRPGQLDEVDWLEPDRPFLPELAGLLARRVGAVRVILFDGDAAERAASRLRREGYDAQVRRERLAGEDDDEDHPWAVHSDAPELVLDLLADELDGWLDTDPATDGATDPATGPAAAPPAPLSSRPRPAV